MLVVALIIGSQLGGDNSNKLDAGGIRPGSVNEMLRGIPQDGIALGNANAPVTLIEIADPQCPGCGEWGRDVLPTVVQDYVRSGKLRIEFRGLRFVDDYPGGSDDSERLLKLALAAGLQDKLWHVVELEFENQGSENSGYATDSFLRAIAEAADGLDAEQALDTWNTPEIERMVQESEQLAEDRLDQIQTPSFLIGRSGTEITELVDDASAAGLGEAIDELSR